MYISNFTYTRALQGVMLAVVIVGALAYMYFLARPVGWRPVVVRSVGQCEMPCSCRL